MKAFLASVAVILGIGCAILANHSISLQRELRQVSTTLQGENQKLTLQNTIYEMERKIAIQEIESLERKPTYDQGYKDALVRVGGPQQPGAYQNGWDDATKLFSDSGYAEGYHNAIQQFGYTQQIAGTKRWLIPDPSLAKVDEPGKINAALDGEDKQKP